jgi:hypothetical protein
MKRPFERLRRGWGNDNKMNIKELGRESVDWFNWFRLGSS